MWKRLVPFFLVLALVAAACGGDDADETTTTAAPETTEAVEGNSVIDLAVANGGFTTLVAAIEAAGLVDTLEGEGPFTVLAPTNAAFDAAFEALGITAEELLADTETLTQILTYHVLPQEANSQLVATLDGEMVETVNGQSASIAVTEGVITIDGAEVVSADLEADNGLIHVINSVLLPQDVAEALGVAMSDEMEMEETTTTTTTTEAPAEPGTIVEVAVESGEFPTLVAALQATGLDEVLSGDGPFTVFAPTEDAFAAALDALGITAEELLADTETLTSILTYHVVAANAPAEVVVTLDGQEVETVNGASVLVTVDGESVMVNEANVVAVDIFGSNGVIHVIDSVLLPPAE